MNDKWSDEELHILNENYHGAGRVKKCAQLLPGRSLDAIAGQAKREGIASSDIWKQWQLDILDKEYDSTYGCAGRIAKKIGKTTVAIRTMAGTRGLTKRNRKESGGE